MIEDSPPVLTKSSVSPRKSLLRVAIPRTPAVSHAPHQNDTEMTIANPPQTPQHRLPTKSSEFSLFKELVKLLPENVQPEPKHDSRWHPTQPFKIFTRNSLPPYETTLMAIEGLFHIQSATLHIYFIGENEARKILEDAYSGNASQLTLCELFAAAAVGSQWEERVPAEVKHAYFNTVKAYLDGCLEEDDLKAMRTFGLCSVFLMSEKQISSWSYIGNALQIGHSRGLQSSQQPENIGYSEWIGFRRLWRTLIFLESWLAASLGRIPFYSPEYGEVDLDESERSLDDQGSIRCNEFQLELVKVGILNANILKMVFATPTVSLRVVRECMLKLEDWFYNLPNDMRLTSILASDASSGERTAVFTIHIMYLTAIILLTRKVMVEMVGGKGNFLDGTIQDSVPYVKACISAAKQTSEILVLFYAEHGGRLFKKCCYSSFNASIILLFHAAQKKLLGQPRARYLNDLNDASKCISTIEACAGNDELAHCYLQLLIPFRKAVGETSEEYSHLHPEISPEPEKLDFNSIDKPSQLSLPDSEQHDIFLTPLSPGNPDAIAPSLLDIIREPHVFGRDTTGYTTSRNYYPIPDKPHPELWTSSSRSSLLPHPSSSLKVHDTQLVRSKGSPSRKRVRDEDGALDRGWKYNKMIRFSPAALEAFLARVA